MERIPRALTIAGSDPSGGAGLQADLKTFTALGVYGMSAVTSVTVQNTERVVYAKELPPELVYDQIKVVAEDIGIDAAKTGMLSGEEVILAVAKAVRDFKIDRLIVDTVLRSKSGYSLLKDEAIRVLVKELFPHALLITPNIPEAEVLCGDRLVKLRDIELCAKKLLSMGPRGVLIKGGHMEGDKAIDVLYTGGDEFHYFVGDRVRTKNLHGTGCTLSAAITALLAKGYEFYEAIKKAKDYVQGAIENSLPLGKGHGPLNHMWNIKGCVEDF
ncbi:hydroxymethylpyrimidine/phosphomethylpyrimidine kinase [Hydrogenivirga caldilitoris]|uniref:hydroxymethylpyrimidine kinase n=1 Tax=Hydrogenivirga caldilitoris TaxID=246264 RepID=A0A497XS25_9AQUI|nr:bifunctional hydroxymethylpyrimidine kinase/phosphomethylpyrimidine kinase [Hydrogenivirga caldilitoris]RLJ71061.1 hydroxymethylpyrimidine/phosphomethylpyrimidine kinase [Hydrogenivirga caldilitoris]